MSSLRDLASTPTPYLYILMRSDLDSLNPGKMVAQGAHAANQFTFNMDRHIEMCEALDSVVPEAKRLIALYKQWKSSTPQGFGVTICLDVTGPVLPLVVETAQRASLTAAADVTHDPSYPIRDGAVTHLLPLDTCGYVFGDKDELRILLGQFDLLA